LCDRAKVCEALSMRRDRQHAKEADRHEPKGEQSGRVSVVFPRADAVLPALRRGLRPSGMVHVWNGYLHAGFLGEERAVRLASYPTARPRFALHGAQRSSSPRAPPQGTDKPRRAQQPRTRAASAPGLRPSCVVLRGSVGDVPDCCRPPALLASVPTGNCRRVPRRGITGQGSVDAKNRHHERGPSPCL